MVYYAKERKSVYMKEDGLKRLLCLSLAALMLFAFGACSGKKDENKENGNTIEEPATPKNQVVHVGETVQYGDLTLTFEHQDLGYQRETLGYTGGEYVPINLYPYVSVHIHCEYHGNEDIYLNRHSFKGYINGNPVDTLSGDMSIGGYMYELSEDGFEDCNNYEFTLTKDRSSGLWIVVRVNEDPETVEFDYVNPAYSDEWGKLTFVVDLP